MLSLLYGTDITKRAHHREVIIEEFSATHKNLSIRIFTDASFRMSDIITLTENSSLFGESFLIIFEHVLQSDELASEFATLLPAFISSPNFFLFIEREISEKDLKVFEKAGADIKGFEVKELKSKEFNIFQLSDALGARNKKESWILFRQALADNKSPEEILGTLFWMVKQMLLVKDKNSESLARDTKTLSPFVVRKAISFAKNFSRTELEKLSSSLNDLYHHAHRGELDLEEGIETLLLSL